MLQLVKKAGEKCKAGSPTPFVEQTAPSRGATAMTIEAGNLRARTKTAHHTHLRCCRCQLQPSLRKGKEEVLKREDYTATQQLSFKNLRRNTCDRVT